MKYADMHCDTLTACCDSGLPLEGCGLQADLKKLKKNGCAVQCLAVFTQGEGSALRFADYLKFYKRALTEYKIKPVLSYSDFSDCLNSGDTGVMLTVENLGFMDCIDGLSVLKDCGVRMASLVWNYENSFAYPNLVFDGGVPDFGKREKRGLKSLGAEAVKALDGLKIIVDISHLSDGGAEEILSGRKIPAVASHSNAFGVCGVSRNLSDGLIKKVADCGGVVGVNFCTDFLGGDGNDTRACVLKHLKHIIAVGGEDVAAFGSDFDGIPAPPDFADCTHMPDLIEYLSANGISGRVLEKLCYANFARVVKEVCG